MTATGRRGRSAHREYPRKVSSLRLPVCKTGALRLSYTGMITYLRRDSNPRPSMYKIAAHTRLGLAGVAPQEGLEPSVFRLTAGCSAD